MYSTQHIMVSDTRDMQMIIKEIQESINSKKRARTKTGLKVLYSSRELVTD